jgi:hypothetical protein
MQETKQLPANNFYLPPSYCPERNLVTGEMGCENNDGGKSTVNRDQKRYEDKCI